MAVIEVFTSLLLSVNFTHEMGFKKNKFSLDGRNETVSSNIFQFCETGTHEMGRHQMCMHFNDYKTDNFVLHLMYSSKAFKCVK